MENGSNTWKNESQGGKNMAGVAVGVATGVCLYLDVCFDLKEGCL